MRQRSATARPISAPLPQGTPASSPRRNSGHPQAVLVSLVHERIRHRRENFVQQQTRRLVNEYGLIAVEALVVRNLVKNSKLAKSIADASWSAFFQTLCSKAEEAGRMVLKVPPAHTSRTCSGCGHTQNMPLAVRVYSCEQCELVLDRDHNASLNILQKAVGRHGRIIPEAPGLCRGESSQSPHKVPDSAGYIIRCVK
jgi:putative transposase